MLKEYGAKMCVRTHFEFNRYIVYFAQCLLSPDFNHN